MTAILTKKFSEFIAGSLNNTNQFVGLSSGTNARFDAVNNWTTAGRPTTPTNFLLGYNTTLRQYEFYDNVAAAWVQLEDSGDFSTLANLKFIVQEANAIAPNAQSLGTLTTGIPKNTVAGSVGVLSISAPLTSIDGLGTGPNTLIYTTAANIYEVINAGTSAVLKTDENGAPAWSGSMTDGQLIIGATGATPAAASLIAGTGITITVGANSIEIDALTSGISWSNVAGTTQAADVDNGYICTNAGATTVTLPATAVIGNTIEVEGLGAGGWILACNSGAQTIQIGGGVTSAGGTLVSAAATDNVQVVCIVANTTFRVQRTNSAGLTIT